MKKIAVILSGCGFQDGSEIHESVLTLLHLNKLEIPYQCMAPKIQQFKVYDYFYKQYEHSQSREVINEAGKIARSDILDISNCNPSEYIGAIFPGGAGAATTLSNFGIDSENYMVQKDVLNFTINIAKEKKPTGFICIAPCLIPGIYGEGVKCTIGNDDSTAKKLEKLGCKHIECQANDIVTDEHNKVVTTPAYMLANNIYEVFEGIEKLVVKVKELI